jgi:putative tryptophan/tyrosine transport system substrate-binding protein
MRRRNFMATLMGAAVTAPSLLCAQQKRIPKVAVILVTGAAEGQGLVTAFESAWPALGWINGKTIQIDYRWAPPALLLAEVVDMVASAPDVILVAGLPILTAVRRATQTIPTVFVGISDPEGQGFVASLARPGGNMTGFANFEPSIGGKWLETLKEAVPDLKRVAVLRFPGTQPTIMRAIEAAAPALGLQCVDCAIRNEDELNAVLGSVGGELSTGIIVMPDPLLASFRATIIDLAAAKRHPAIYPVRVFPDQGGLMSYGVDLPDQVRRSASYINRIIKGAKPADLPVQAPTKFELVINLKTAEALKLAVPVTLLTRADAVID